LVQFNAKLFPNTLSGKFGCRCVFVFDQQYLNLFKVISDFRNYRPMFEILNSFYRILNFWRKKSNKLTSDRNEWKIGRKEDKKWNERKGWNVKYDPTMSDRVCVEGIFLFFIFHNYWFSLWYRTISVSRKFLKVIEIGFTFHNKTLITCAKTFYP
jgi:hypothetical protein